ncbi:MAG: M60 family metallopeptidase, partial [Nannocystaceae bacterium]
ALPSNDLGETYETRSNATGSKQLTITSDAETVPTLDAADATAQWLDTVASGWVEVRGQHVILTLPAATAAQDAELLAEATDLLDAMYELHAELRGALPQHGQRIRFFPDPNIEGIGYMLAGNPVRMDTVLVEADNPNRISNAGEPGVDVWGFAHELGHDFTFVNALWWYQENSLESWPNIFSIHALEALGLEIHANALACDGAPPVAYDGWDAWSGLCFLLEFQTTYGWAFYTEFFAALNTTPHGDVPGGPMAWHWVHDQFEAVAGDDLTPTFAAWNVPNPG